ncbi:sugar transferase [Viridibacillus arvi]|uniref:sugar transferase n=1 Tax=Viridibacillus arvi TaxID=263475 RepID=UPI00187B1809|nr:sugar transferase [Viridibacillus sp. JNUCC-6]QOV11678.1 sugar transferase [Viridibacillus sp. JNUCC-6]
MQVNLIDRPSFYAKYGKRLLDIFISSVILPIVVLFMLIIAISLLIVSGRPIFFTQERTGLNYSNFQIWKFRTMRINQIQKSKVNDWVGGVPEQFVFKNSQDTRMTGIGKLLRKLSLDELPQIINVLKGEMSLVGPRPEVPEITAYYNLEQSKRLYMKPGITGLAQINGRSNIPHGRKINYDIDYVENCSFLLDIKILMRTISVVFSREGAY